MIGIDSLVTAGGGAAHKRELAARGATDRDLTWAVRNGLLRRARRGWYTTFERSDPRYKALRVGGRLTGASALAFLSAWQWSDRPPVTVSVPLNASRLRRVRGTRVVWDSLDVGERGSAWSVGPRDALREALLEVSFEEAVALLDWAVPQRVIDLDEIGRLVAGLPGDLARIEGWVDPACESFLESIVRTRLRLAGYSVASQETLANGQRIDLVVEGVVGLETDGREFHAGSFEADRRKDLEIVVGGKAVLRLSYSMVRDEWERVLAAVEAAVRNHRRGTTRRVGNSGSWPRAPRRGLRLWRLRPVARGLHPELPTDRRTPAPPTALAEVLAEPPAAREPYGLIAKNTNAARMIRWIMPCRRVDLPGATVRVLTSSVTPSSTICTGPSPSSSGPSSQMLATAIAGIVSPMLAMAEP